MQILDPQTVRCPRCHGNLALDQDRVWCLACGHEVIPRAEQAQVVQAVAHRKPQGDPLRGLQRKEARARARAKVGA